MRYKVYIFTMLCMLFSACDYIAEEDRLIEVAGSTDNPAADDSVATVRSVLLEDFTGQRCSNCPTGSAVIEQLRESYGERVIAVGIHGGPLGFSGSATVVGLATSVGDEYYNYWKLEYQPVGLIDRHGAVNYTDWITEVNKELARESQHKMELQAALTGDRIDISVTDRCLYGSFAGKLQVWLLEDSIVAIQTMPDGTNNREYVHNHVLRTPVNGTWGTDFSISAGEQKSASFTQTVESGWNSERLSIVAFVYGDDGVEQAVKKAVAKLE